MNFTDLIVTWLVTTVSLLLLSKLPLGIEIDSFGKALISAAVFGFLNGLVKPILFWLTLPITILSLGLFWLLLNPIIFGLAAALVQGFRLRWGFWSAIIGSVALSIINSIIYKLFGLAS
jgi:putative membrane protein